MKTFEQAYQELKERILDYYKSIGFTESLCLTFDAERGFVPVFDGCKYVIEFGSARKKLITRIMYEFIHTDSIKYLNMLVDLDIEGLNEHAVAFRIIKLTKTDEIVNTYCRKLLIDEIEKQANAGKYFLKKLYDYCTGTEFYDEWSVYDFVLEYKDYLRAKELGESPSF
jgi:hypothetical protein